MTSLIDLKSRLTNIHAAHAWEGLACDRSRAARDLDIKAHGVDMVRVRAEQAGWGNREQQPGVDPYPLWHEHSATARAALGPAASDRDVSEYAVRLDWGLPPHGAMSPMTPEEWAGVRGLEASWYYRKGMSEEGLEEHITTSPEHFYPDVVAPGALVELVRAAYAKAIQESAGAPFLPADAGTWDLTKDHEKLRWKDWNTTGRWEHFDLLVSQGVDVALLREECEAAEPKFVYVPWGEYFTRALKELGPTATEREVNQRAAVLAYVPTVATFPPWSECLDRAAAALGGQANARALHEYAERLRRGLKPHTGDTLDREAWVRRHTAYLMRFRFRFMMFSDELDELASTVVEHTYLDTPKNELKAELIAGYEARCAEEHAAYEARQLAEHKAHEAGKTEALAMLEAPGAPPIEEFHRAACEYRKSGVWMSKPE